LNVEVSITPVVVATGIVVIENDAVKEPEGTTTVDGTAATAGLLDERLTVVSVVAGALSATVPVATLPPVTDDGATLAARTGLIFDSPINVVKLSFQIRPQLNAFSFARLCLAHQRRDAAMGGRDLVIHTDATVRIISFARLRGDVLLTAGRPCLLRCMHEGARFLHTHATSRVVGHS
jgi:hypothetical protein